MRGFGEYVAQFNDVVQSDEQIETSLGVGYSSHGYPYVDPIHYKVIVESQSQHFAVAIHLSQLSSSKQNGNSVYMGAAGFLNLYYLSQIKPDAAVIYDINILQKHFWQMVFSKIKIMPKSEQLRNWFLESEAEFELSLKQMFNDSSEGVYTRNDLQSFHDMRSFYRHEGYALDDYMMSRSLETEWMTHDEEAYNYIRDMVLADKIGLLTLSITDAKSCLKFRKHLKAYGEKTDQDQDPQIDYLYVSNILDWVNGRDNWTKQAASHNKIDIALQLASRLVAKDGVMIRAYTSQRRVELISQKNIYRSECAFV